MKRCWACGAEKLLEDFAGDRSRLDGRKSQCKACDRGRSASYYRSNKTAVRERQKRRPKVSLPRKPPKPCKEPGCDQLAASGRHWYCKPHSDWHARIKARDRSPGKTGRRGYGREHQAQRDRWATLVARGEVACARCGKLVYPTEKWDLDHTDDRAGYLGPSHQWCNRSAAAVKGNQARGIPTAPGVRPGLPTTSRLPGW